MIGQIAFITETRLKIKDVISSAVVLCLPEQSERRYLVMVVLRFVSNFPTLGQLHPTRTLPRDSIKPSTFYACARYDNQTIASAALIMDLAARWRIYTAQPITDPEMLALQPAITNTVALHCPNPSSHHPCIMHLSAVIIAGILSIMHKFSFRPLTTVPLVYGSGMSNNATPFP